MTAPTTALGATTPPSGWRARLRPAALAGAAVLFWWGATGVLLALQRSAHTRAAALALGTAAAAAGLALAVSARRTSGAAGGARAVFAGTLLWTAVSATFYGGWIVGPAARVVGGAGTAPSLARAAEAVAATAYSSLLAAALLGAALLVAARRGRALGSAPLFAPAAFAVLWGAHELAKLNVFLGVANAGGELLPAYLAPLRAYFGPARNSLLLAPSVVVLAAAAAAATAGAVRTPHAARRTGLALVAGVLALAALEHALLGAAAPVRWWDAFLRWRGAA